MRSKKEIRHKNHFFLSTWQSLRQILGLAVTFNLVIEILISLLLMPLSRNLLFFSLESANLDYLTNSDLKVLLSEPLSMLSFILLFAIFMVLSLFRITSMYTLANNPSIRSLGNLVRQSVAEFHCALKNQSVIGVIILIIAHPFSNFVFLLSFYFRFGLDRVINMQDWHFGTAIVIILIINSFTMFVYPIVFLEGKTIRKAIVEGFRIICKHWLRNMFYLVVALFWASILILGMYLIISMFITLALANNGTAEGVFGMFLSAVQILETAITLVTVVIFSIINSFVAARLYRLCKREEMFPDFPQIDSRKVGIKYWTISIILLTAVFSLSLIGPKYFRNTFTRYAYYLDLTCPEIIAHKGFSSEAPENTVAAVESAIEAGADRIEIDVQTSKDGVVYLMHDESLLRTTGVNAAMSEMFSWQIDRMDAGSWFSADFKGEHVPSLREILEECHGKIALKIELKSENGNEIRLAEKVVNLVQEADMSESVMISSFNGGAIKRVKELDDSIMTGLIATTVYGNYRKIEYADAIVLNQVFLSADRINTIHQAGKLVYCWTSNSPQYISGMSRIGVDGIITDYPVSARIYIYGADFDTELKNILYKLLGSMTNLRYLTP